MACVGAIPTVTGMDMSNEQDTGCEVGSGNVFADIGHPDPDTALAKAQLARQIATIIEQRGWTQTEAATALGIDQPKVSALMRGRLREFSADRLLRFLTRLDRDVDITVSVNVSPGRRARIAVYGSEEPLAASPPSRTAERVQFE